MGGRRRPPGARVCETGIGSGYGAIWLSLRGVAAEGIDQSPAIVERARAVNNTLGGRASFRAGDLFRFYEPGRPRCQVVHHQGVLEHFPVPQVRAALAQQVAMAHWVVFSVPSMYYPFEPEFGDERMLSLEEWERILAPFDVAELRYYVPRAGERGSGRVGEGLAGRARRAAAHPGGADLRNKCRGPRVQETGAPRAAASRAERPERLVATMTAPANSIGTARTPAVRHEAGRQVALLDARGSLNTSLYDARGLLVGTQDPLGAWTTFQHDARGDQSLRIDARGWPTTYTVDALGRQVGTLYRDGGRVTNTYDPAGRQTTMQDRTGVTTYVWDGAGRQSAVVHSIGLALTYTHDAVGNRASMLGPDGVTTYAWDANNRVSGVVNPHGEVTTLGYDALDRQVQLVYGNGMVASHAYDAAGRETARQYLDAAGTPLQWYTATYDAAGNRLTQLSLDGVGRTYTYDAAGQLIEEARVEGASVEATTYAYDGVGNRLARSGDTEYQYNTASELLGITAPGTLPTTETWDANGNRATWEKGQAVTYTWDADNRLERKESDGAVSTFAYVADGRRVRKATPEETILYAWDGWNVVAGLNAGLELQAAYTRLPGDWAGLLSDRRLGVSRFYAYDLQGSTALLVGADGSVLVRQEYPAFGGPGADTTTPFWYVGNQGYQWDGGEQANVGHRVLDTDEGRWMSRDPVAVLPDGDRYGYCGSNPVSRVDPAGLEWWGPVPPPWPGYGAGRRKPGPRRVCRPSLVAAAVSAGPCSSRFRGCYTACQFSLEADWTLSWQIPGSDDISGCAVYQYYRGTEYCRNIYTPITVVTAWTPDSKLGWPYPPNPPVGSVRRGGNQRCQQSDNPIRGNIIPLALTTCTMAGIVQEFVTCLCASSGLVQCYWWQVNLTVDLSTCRTTCYAVGPSIRAAPVPLPPPC